MRIRDDTDVLVIVRNNTDVVVYLDEDNTIRMPVKVWRKLNAEVERKVRA